MSPSVSETLLQVGFCVGNLTLLEKGSLSKVDGYSSQEPNYPGHLIPQATLGHSASRTLVALFASSVIVHRLRNGNIVRNKNSLFKDYF